MHRIVLSLFLFLTIGNPLFAQKKLSLADFNQNYTFQEKTVQGLHSSANGLYYTTLEDGKRIVKYSYKDGKKVETVFDLDQLENAAISHFSAYSFSDDETKILLTTEREQIYRHTFSANYYVWNSVTEELAPLSEKGKQQEATFSPNGERVAFVRDNNIFIKTLRFGTENQVTNDGQKNAIINGVPDWVYEEEFAFSKAFAWSPDSKFLAYIRFDETAVKEYSMKMFQGKSPSLKENAGYPGEYTYKYPKAGEQNSLISVFSYDLKSKTKIEVDLGEETDIYVPRLKWTADANDLAVFRLNRRQNKIDVLFANPHTGDSRLFFTEKNDRYIGEDFLDDFIFLPDNDYFVVNSERDGFSHLYLYDRQGFEVRQLTQGEYDVTDFYGFDSKKKIFYYQAAKKSPMQREVYYVSLDKKKQGTLSPKEGTNKAVFSSGFQYFINEYTSLDTPKTFSLYDNKGNLVRVLEDNKALNEKLSEYTISSKSFFNFETSEGVSLNGWMIKPLNFDESKQYPVVMTQYSGPNSQQVLDRWSVSWYNYLAQEGFLVVCVDPRGTGARGQDFRKVTYMQLGKYESDDQVEAARYLTTLPYVDKNNISIWGWSYGGFMTLLSMEKGGDLFKAGVAIAPVANFKFYDTVYTERFMRTPLENPDGYEDNAPLNHPEGITGRLLLIHGSADDNVHLQNTMEMAEALVQANVQFDMAIYTNRNHGIYGGNTRMHLYQRVTDFLKNQLQ
ncbi:S9 family peptidase [Sunxiuqinia elliptica]|uniref:Dipeptidyl-peptidase-4 n=1 Tax=Sunxiuqinia elliptica TaxID=655355 RepID=A0A4R6GPT1_9BACT|nr:S9 family peptidase [Sunxiuqinia elliptica]TDN97166.1 dipeptidyl-peptidase-4 [Sunxiuqinia elliptica]TDO60650.1 dipeptidyl-peptidase-4 [Sunxiuqinia elliptica]